MARSGQYSRSVLGASDQVRDIYCEPCHKVGHVAIAEGYCVDCPEYLCGPCYKIHRHHKALANHVLLDKNSMPLTTDFSRKNVDACEKKCPTHSNQVIELFCETCDKLVCHICVAIDHRRCEKVKHIPDIVKGVEHTEEFQKLIEDIKSTAKALSNHEEKLQANVTSNQEIRKLAKQELKRQRAQVNSFFDQLEKKMDDQVIGIEKRNNNTLKAASNRLDQMKTDLDQIKNEIEATNTGQRCELFIAMKQSQKRMKTFFDQFEKMQEELRIQHYVLVPSEQIQAMMRNTTEICRIATARFESEIDIKTTDANEQLVCSLAIIHANYCVALDFLSIKVIDTKSKCVTSQTPIEAEDIWSLTSVSTDQVAVSVSSDGRDQIQFFTVSASGVIQRTNQQYDVDHCCYGMVHSAGNIYGVKYNRIDKINMTGKTERTIYMDYMGGLERIAVSPDGQTIYVTASNTHSVISVTLDGKVKAVYKDKDLKKPVGITVDKHGYVYVCSRDSNNIQQLTADLSKVQVLIDDSSGAITYSSTENKLFISDGKKIHPYSLDFK